uniref:Mytilin 6 n=1 Tax=Perna canaliculus TaxID=38949 RepID=A0A6B9XPZ4_PERCI|nr:mytilin 6 [Perna canaliculus]
MKTAVLLLVVLVACFMVSDALVYCDLCRWYCSNKGCAYYLCGNKFGNNYCCCFKCAADTDFNIGRVAQPQVEDETEMMNVEQIGHD